MYRDIAAPISVLRTSSVLSLLLFGLASTWTDRAQALGLGRPQMRTALGQTLQIEFPLILSAGESLSADCVSAEVLAGTGRLPAAAVRWQLQGASETSVRALRVFSTVKIEEPIITVTLNLGCPTRLTRQYSALLDPPQAHGAAGVAELSELDAPASPPSYTPALRAALATTGAKPQELLDKGQAELAGAERFVAGPAVADNARAKAVSAKAADEPTQAKPSAKSASKGSSKASRDPAPAAAGAMAVPVTALAQGKSKPEAARAPQLRLEPLDLVVSAATQAQLAASAAEAEVVLQRLQALESGLGKLREDKRVSELKLNEMRTRLTAQNERETQTGVPMAWLLGLGAVCLGLVALSAYLWHSRKQAQLGLADQWWAATGLGRPNVEEEGAARAEASTALAAQEPKLSSSATGDGQHVERTSSPPREALEPFKRDDERTLSLARLTDEDHSLDFAHPGPTVPGALSDALPDSLVERLAAAGGAERSKPDGDLDPPHPEPLSVQFLDAAHFAEAAPTAGQASIAEAVHGQGLVSVEALIDLEQQTDFFLVLGQEDAAVDLLQESINSPVDSALPFLKLMEICQRRGDALAFADLAGRYALRFDAIAPTWDQDLSMGRDLEVYAEIMRDIQGRWSDSGASMSLLQKLLSNQGLRGLNLDLPALRDLLLLYSVARDRSEHEVRGQEIDLFLPLESELSSQTGFGMMATMVWQGAAAPTTAAAQPVDVDIVLDELPAQKP